MSLTFLTRLRKNNCISLREYLSDVWKFDASFFHRAHDMFSRIFRIHAYKSTKCLLTKIFNNPNSVFAMQEEGWKLNRNHYYQEGWLSTANLRGVVGVTYTTSHCGIDGSTQLVPPSRTNYNLRGHRAEVGNLKKNFLGLRTGSSVSKAEKNWFSTLRHKSGLEKLKIYISIE